MINLNKALDQGLREIAGELSKNLTSRGSVASGKLGESISVDVQPPRGGRWTATITMLDYWEAVDQGRASGSMPPVSDIITWMRYPNVQDRLTGGTGNIKDSTKIPGIAYAIARKIERVGTEGTSFATDVFESKLIDKLSDRMAEAVSEGFDDVITELQKLADA